MNTTNKIKSDYTVSRLKKYFKKYNLNDIGWTYGFNNNKRRGGVTKYTSKTIYISNYYIFSETTTKKDIKNTILHEIAHALSPIGSHHNHIWKRKALEIGCNGERCLRQGFMKDKDFKYIYKCSQGCQYKRHRTTKKWKEGKYRCVKHHLTLTL